MIVAAITWDRAALVNALRYMKLSRCFDDAYWEALTEAADFHAARLAGGAPCPIDGSAQTLALLSNYPLDERRIVAPRSVMSIGNLAFEAFPVEHSVRAPAVGYRIPAGKGCFVYVPDVARIHDLHGALHGAGLYIGDGASITRPIVRWQNGAMTGHSPITTQLGWCEKEAVPLAAFTHCGSKILRGDARALRNRVHRLGREHGGDARIAHDRIRLLVREHGTVGARAAAAM